MNEQQLVDDARHLSGWKRHKFLLLVALTIIISLFMVVVSLYLYNSSGAAQLDLSRPGYKSVRDKASRSDNIDSFPSSGGIDEAALKSFEDRYLKQLQRITQFDGFGGDVMSDEALGLTPILVHTPAN